MAWICLDLCLKWVKKFTECPNRCSTRCGKTQYHKPCMFFCQKCCRKCLCVPPGYYGNKAVCPCYNNWKTKEGGPKCPWKQKFIQNPSFSFLSLFLFFPLLHFPANSFPLVLLKKMGLCYVLVWKRRWNLSLIRGSFFLTIFLSDSGFGLFMIYEQWNILFLFIYLCELCDVLLALRVAMIKERILNPKS